MITYDQRLSEISGNSALIGRKTEELKKYRKTVQGGINKAFKMFVKDSEANKNSTEFAVKQMSEKLNYDPKLCDKLIPKWELGCRYKLAAIWRDIKRC